MVYKKVTKKVRNVKINVSEYYGWSDYYDDYAGEGTVTIGKEVFDFYDDGGLAIDGLYKWLEKNVSDDNKRDKIFERIEKRVLAILNPKRKVSKSFKIIL